MFPEGFIDETLRTLVLLFPQSDPKTREWFRKLSRTSNLDFQAVKYDGLRAIDRHIDNFAFWHDRLVVLKQVFDEAEPSTLSQWWCDRRNVVQWYTFWVAIPVLVFTLVTPITSLPAYHLTPDRRYEEAPKSTTGFMVILHTTRFGRQVWLQVLWDS